MDQKTPILSPQVIAIIGSLLTFLAGMAASQNLISKATYDYLVSPETVSVVGIVAGAIVAAYLQWRRRPHGMIQDTAALKQVDAVVAKPKTAGEIPVANVVGSVDAASRVPGITQGGEHVNRSPAL